MSKKKKPMIQVETRPNGYSLCFDGMKQSGGYLYFSPEKLLAGFMLHIGLGITDQLDTQTMNDFIATALNWKDNKACVEEIQRLTAELKLMTSRRNGLAKRLIDERYKHLELVAAIETMLDEYKSYPDKNVCERLKKIVKMRKTLTAIKPSTLKIDDIDIEDTNDEDL